MEFTLGIGFTTIENVRVAPEQELDIGVTVNTLNNGIFERELVVNANMFPVPERGAKPIKLELCVQLYVVFATREPVKIMSLVSVPLHLT